MPNTQDIIDEALSAKPVDQLSPEAREYRSTGKLPAVSAVPQPVPTPQIAPETPKIVPGTTQPPLGVPNVIPPPVQPPMGRVTQTDATIGAKPTQVGGTFGERTFTRKGEDVFETTGGQMRQVTFGEFQRELQPKGLNLEVLPQLPADKTAGELDEILGKIFDAGLKQEDMKALLKSASQPEKEKTEDVFGDIARSYGLDPAQLFADLKARPAKSFEDLYAQLYQQEGLGNLKTEIEKLTTQLDGLNKDFQGRVDQINENPFISERTRLGQIDVEEQKYNRSRANIVDLLQLATTRFEKGRDDIRDFADRALDKASEERKFAKEQLDFLVKRTEKELEAGRRLRKEGFEREKFGLEERRLRILEHKEQRLSEPDGNSTFTSTFTKGQLNKGAASADISLQDFRQLDADTQNFFINRSGDIRAKRKLIDDAKVNKEDPRLLEKEISESDAPPAVKDSLVRYLKSVFRDEYSSFKNPKKPWWQRLF